MEEKENQALTIPNQGPLSAEAIQMPFPNIFQRIIGIMSELKQIYKGKLKVNGQYTFVSHDAVAAEIHPLLVKYGIVVIPTVEEMAQDNNRTMVKLAVSFVNPDMPKDNFMVKYHDNDFVIQSL